MITPEEADRLRILGDHITESQLDGASLINRVAADAEAVADVMLWLEVGNDFQIGGDGPRSVIVEVRQVRWESLDRRRAIVIDEWGCSFPRGGSFHQRVAHLMLTATEELDVNGYRERLPQHRRPHESLDAQRRRFMRTQASLRGLVPATIIRQADLARQFLESSPTWPSSYRPTGNTPPVD